MLFIRKRIHRVLAGLFAISLALLLIFFKPAESHSEKTSEPVLLKEAPQKDLHQHSNLENSKNSDKNRDEDDSIERTLSESDFKTLLSYSEKRGHYVFLERIEDELSEDLKKRRHVASIKKALAKDLQAPYSPEMERRHLSMLNYLEDASLGRFKHERSREALDAVVSLLTEIPIDTKMPKRHLQFQIGDKVDLMMIWTQENRDEAFRYLSSQIESPLFSYLKEGYFNGLFFLGLKQKDLNALIAYAGALGE
ncbi:MAG: hypothetical protein HYW48_08375 [Deltaproteobacteria bacterium]|nr:hypothetical protein [Deltaproteobacteria bacterium]